MSVSPAGAPQRPPEESNSSNYARSVRPRRPRIWTICFALLALEIGVFLIVFPWLDAWRLNHFPALYPPLFDIWNDPYFRGAISGLGVVDLLIAIWQAVYFVRSSKTS